MLVPAGIQGQLVVGQHEGTLLVGSEMAEDNDRHMAVGELAQGQHAAMAGDDSAVRIDQNRIVEPKLGDAGGDLCDLSVGVSTRVTGVGNQAFYRPGFNLEYLLM